MHLRQDSGTQVGSGSAMCVVQTTAGGFVSCCECVNSVRYSVKHNYCLKPFWHSAFGEAACETRKRFVLSGAACRSQQRLVSARRRGGPRQAPLRQRRRPSQAVPVRACCVPAVGRRRRRSAVQAQKQVLFAEGGRSEVELAFGRLAARKRRPSTHSLFRRHRLARGAIGHGNGHGSLRTRVSPASASAWRRHQIWRSASNRVVCMPKTCGRGRSQERRSSYGGAQGSSCRATTAATMPRVWQRRPTSRQESLRRIAG